MRASGKRGSVSGHSLSAAPVAALVLTAMVALSSATQAKPKFVTFMVGSAPTQPTSINAKGAVTGFAGGGAEGFVRQSGGTIDAFAVPGAVHTYPTSINKKGEVTGRYDKPERPERGFLRRPDGTIRTFKLSQDNRGDFPVTVNSVGTIFGYYVHRTTHHGFIRSKSGQIATFDCPDGQTSVAAGNNFDAVTGVCNDGSFIRSSDGVFTFFDAGQLAQPVSLNDDGAVTGTTDFFGGEGFIRTPDGTITDFAVPGSSRTTPSSINASGVVTGNFVDSDSVSHGFIRTVDGMITTFDPEGSIGTSPTGINDRGAVVGVYADQNNQVWGFIRFP